MLTDTALRALKPATRPYKRADSKGLHILVTPGGSKLWRLAYRFGGKQKLLALGPYPEVSLAEARDRTDAARRLLRDGTDPAEQRRQKRAQSAVGETFEAVGKAWQAKRALEVLSDSARRKDTQILDGLVYPALGKRPIREITAMEILTVIRRCEARGHHETAHRTRGTVSRVFRWAVASGIAERDPAADLKDALVSHRNRHHAALFDAKEIGALIRAMRGYEGRMVSIAMQIAAYTFVRPGELRRARWQEIEGDLWRIPSGRMKMRRDHIVPLAPQVVALLAELRAMTGGGEYLFGLRRPMSDGTVNAALRRMGYTKDQIVGHGLRRTASTVLNESGLWREDVIERQLAHVDSSVRGIYNAALYLDERRQMMCWYADWLDGVAKTPPGGTGGNLNRRRQTLSRGNSASG